MDIYGTLEENSRTAAGQPDTPAAKGRYCAGLAAMLLGPGGVSVLDQAQRARP
jgi:hypothetical protein